MSMTSMAVSLQLLLLADPMDRDEMENATRSGLFVTQIPWSLMIEVVEQVL
jgi:hypothetical protein